MAVITIVVVEDGPEAVAVWTDGTTDGIPEDGPGAVSLVDGPEDGSGAVSLVDGPEDGSGADT